MHHYHITITMPDSSQGTHEGLYPHGAAAAMRAEALFPDAARLEVLRLSTVLQRQQLCEQQQQPRAAA
jgi:hypothetical protein